jgi:hypothetical protein
MSNEDGNKLYTVIIYFVTCTANGRKKNERADMIVMATSKEIALEKATEKLSKAHYTRGFSLREDCAATVIESDDGIIFA